MAPDAHYTVVLSEHCLVLVISNFDRSHQTFACVCVCVSSCFVCKFSCCALVYRYDGCANMAGTKHVLVAFMTLTLF